MGSASGPTVIGSGIASPTFTSLKTAVRLLTDDLKRIQPVPVPSQEVTDLIANIIRLGSSESLNLNALFGSMVDLVGAYLALICATYHLHPRQATFYSRVNVVEVIIAYCKESWRSSLTKNSLWALANRRGQPGSPVNDATFAEVEETCYTVRRFFDFAHRLVTNDVEVFDELYVSTGALLSLGKIYKGRITKYNEHGRFGFIQVALNTNLATSHDVFFHENNVDRPDRPSLGVGRWVQFLEVPSQKKDRDVQFEAREVKVCADDDLPVVSKTSTLLKMSSAAPEFKAEYPKMVGPTAVSPRPPVSPRREPAIRASHESLRSASSHPLAATTSADLDGFEAMVISPPRQRAPSHDSVGSSTSSQMLGHQNLLAAFAKIPLFITCQHCREDGALPITLCSHLSLCRSCTSTEGLRCPVCDSDAKQMSPSTASVSPSSSYTGRSAEMGSPQWDPFRAVKVSSR